jgi:hypothetical protein
MTSTDRLLAGVIAALFVLFARLNEMKAALGVVIVCVAFATTAEVMIATTAANNMAAHRGDFCIRIIMVFILLIPFGSVRGRVLQKIRLACETNWFFEESKPQSTTPSFTAAHTML